MTVVDVTVGDIVSLTCSAEVLGSTRTHLSVLHLLSAATHSRAVYSLEQENNGKGWGDHWETVFAFASGAVFTSVAALEAYANELFVDCHKVFPEFPAPAMEKLWESYEQKSILDKFQFALLLKRAQSFDPGAALYGNVFALIRLRNGLTHFKPEWTDEPDEHRRISASLAGRFTPTPFLAEGSESLFPRAWASHSCAQWAIRSVLNFAQEVDGRMQLEGRFAPFRERVENA